MAATLLAGFFLEGNGGNWIGGIAVAIMMLFCSVAGGVVFLLAWFSAWRLARGGERKFARGMGWLSLALAVFAIAVLGVQANRDADKADEQQTQMQAMQRDTALGERVVASEDALSTFVATHGATEPVPGTQETPLEVALSKNYTALTEKLLAEGGLVDANGNAVLTEAFTLGQEEVVHLVLNKGVAPDRVLLVLVSRSAYASFVPGDIDWQKLLSGWSASGTPASIQRGFSLAGESGEAHDIAALNVVLNDDNFYREAHLDTLPLQPWVKETPNPGWNNSPLLRSINRQILAALYPQAIAPFGKSKSARMLCYLAAHLSDKIGAGDQALATSVNDDNTELLSLLKEAGLDIHRLDGFSRTFLDVPDDRNMRDYLRAQGVHLKN